MKNVYDNGRLILGDIFNIKKFLYENRESCDEIEEIIEELKYENEDTIVTINYDKAIGFDIEYWKQKDIVKEKNKIYIVNRSYRNFEEYDNNFTKCLGTFKVFEDAVNCIIEAIQEELNHNMLFWKDNLNNINGLSNEIKKGNSITLHQAVGSGEVDLLIEEMRLS